MRSLSNILKSDSILICEEKKYIFNTRCNVIAYPSTKKKEEEQKILVDLEEMKRQAECQAKQIIDNAERYAKKIVEEAEIKSQTILDEARKKAYKEGYTEGYNKGIIEGRNKGESEYQDSIRRINAEKEEYRNLRERLYKSCEQDVIRLAIDIARKIIDVRLEDDEKVYLRIAEKTLAEIKGQKSICLRCSSKDYPTVKENKNTLISTLDGVDDITVIEDMFLDQGSCIVESEGGGVDGSVDTQIDNIKKAFKTILQESVDNE